MGACSPDWPGDNGGGEYAPPRCPAVLGATCAPDVACECRDTVAPAVAAAMRRTPTEGLTVAKLREAADAMTQPPAVHGTLRSEALDRAAKALPADATPAQLVSAAYLIGLFLDTGRA